MSATTIAKPALGAFGYYFPGGSMPLEHPKHGKPCKVVSHLERGVMVEFQDPALGTDFAGEGQFHPDTSAAW